MTADKGLRAHVPDLLVGITLLLSSPMPAHAVGDCMDNEWYYKFEQLELLAGEQGRLDKVRFFGTSARIYIDESPSVSFRNEDGEYTGELHGEYLP